MSVAAKLKRIDLHEEAVPANKAKSIVVVVWT